MTFGGVDSLGSATIAVFSLKGAQDLFQRGDTVDSILVSGKPGYQPGRAARSRSSRCFPRV